MNKAVRRRRNPLLSKNKIPDKRELYFGGMASESSHRRTRRPLLTQLDSPLVWFSRRILQMLAKTDSYANRAGSMAPMSKIKFLTSRNYILEAWVGIEPAYKDLQSSA